MIHAPDASQLVSLLIVTATTLGLPFWGWMRVLGAYRVQEARRRHWDEQKEMQRRQAASQLAAMRQSILRAHGLDGAPAADQDQ